jgi:hypothetical protein
MMGVLHSYDILRRAIMAGRYLLIEFDDAATATILREQINAATRKGKKFRVVGLFIRPSRACQCGPSHDIRHADQVKRGGKFGWWVCTRCNRPRMGDHQLNNQLAPNEILEPNQFDGVDALNPSMDMKPYIRHASGLSIHTLPAAIALGDEN